MSTDINVNNYIQSSWRQVEALEEVTGQFDEQAFNIGEVLPFVFILIVFLVGVLLGILAIKRLASKV